MKLHSDPTANQATGRAQKEWIKMAALAIRIRRSHDDAWAEAQKKRYTGIFRRMLTDPEEELLEEIPPGIRKKNGI